MKNGVMYGFPAGLVLAMKQRAQKTILGSASFWRAAQFFGNSIAFMFPVSTPAKAASLPLPKSKVNSRAPTSASGSKSRAELFQNLLPRLPHTPKRNIWEALLEH